MMKNDSYVLFTKFNLPTLVLHSVFPILSSHNLLVFNEKEKSGENELCKGRLTVKKCIPKVSRKKYDNTV